MENEPDVLQGQESTVRTRDKLGKEWSTFLGILFSPIVLVLIGATVLFIYLLLSNPSTNPLPAGIEAALTVIIAISSGLAGAEVSRRWSEVNETSVLVTRGKSAIRGLKLLSTNISNLERRVTVYISKICEPNTDEESNNFESVLLTYEEIIERCSVLQEEAINAIEEWQDIIPEVANLKTKIGEYTELRLNQARLRTEKAQLEEELETTRAESEGENAELRARLNEKQRELERISNRLNHTSSIISDVSVIGQHRSGFNPPVARYTTCTKCGQAFLQMDTNDRVCPNCGHREFFDTIPEE